MSGLNPIDPTPQPASWDYSIVGGKSVARYSGDVTILGTLTAAIAGLPVSVLAYGADPTGVANSTAAFMAAMAASDNVFIPDGIYLLDKLTPQIIASKALVVTGTGVGNVVLVSRAGDHIFEPIGALIGGLRYVSFFQVGGFTARGQGAGTGAGYAVHIKGAAGVDAPGYNNFIHDIDATAMGGGCIKDEAGLFSSSFVGLRGGESGAHVFDMHGGGPDSAMVNCYARNALKNFAGYRVHNRLLVLQTCNGLNVDTASGSFWGVFGEQVTPVSIIVTNNGAITFPAGASVIAAGTRLQNCNIEAFPDVALLCLNGTVFMDNACLFQTASGIANCIAIYCTDITGSGEEGVLPPLRQFVLVGGSWALSSPIWIRDTTLPFVSPLGDPTHTSINLRDYGDALTFALDATYAQNMSNQVYGPASLNRYTSLVNRCDGVFQNGVSGTVAALAAAFAPGVFPGARAFVTDSTVTTTAGIGLAVVGGGANFVPVYSDGATYRIG